MEIKLERELCAGRTGGLSHLSGDPSFARESCRLPGWSRSFQIVRPLRSPVKEKKGRLTAKLFVRFSTLEHYDQPRREAVEQGVEKFKVVKKRLGTSFANLKKAAAQGKLPGGKSAQGIFK